MQQNHCNMQEVRNTMRVRKVWSKIEQIILEHIEHIMKMENGCIVKIVTLEWYVDLKDTSKVRRINYTGRQC